MGSEVVVMTVAIYAVQLYMEYCGLSIYVMQKSSNILMVMTKCCVVIKVMLIAAYW